MVPQFSHSADSPIGILTFTWEIGGAGSVPVDQGGIFSDDCVSLANFSRQRKILERGVGLTIFGGMKVIFC
jgi:hypothetical protein